MREMQLSQSKIALVDDEDYWYLMQFTWHAINKGDLWYARHSFKKPNFKFGYSMYMHNLLMDSTNQVDHVDRNGLNNARNNLRFATSQQNSANSIRKIHGTSIFKGVSWSGKRWRAQIKVNGITKNLGEFIVEEDAARAYDEAAKEYFGAYAILNKIEFGDLMVNE